MGTVKGLEDCLEKMNPKLYEERYWFATVDESELMAIANYLDSVVCIYREEEGLTIVFTDDIKDEVEELTQEKIAGPFAKITLNVYSDLEATVGFLAKITDALAKERISVNAFSAYHHDHLFVPYEKKEKTMGVLKALTKV